MDEKLISKKQLLQRFGISYGALYRWKRKGLIPEDWFIKKSTVTGQETFFPESRICERIQWIQNQKDEASLDALARQLGQEDHKKATLTLKTAFGDKTFYLHEIYEVILDDGAGGRQDITKEILKNKDK